MLKHHHCFPAALVGSNEAFVTSERWPKAKMNKLLLYPLKSVLGPSVDVHIGMVAMEPSLILRQAAGVRLV